MSLDVINAGNLTECQTPAVLRKINSEARKAEDLHRECLIDIMVTQQVLADVDVDSHTILGYIQHISVLPLMITMYRETQLRLLVKLQKKGRVILHIDATGSVCAKLKSLASDKRILYYAAVVANTKGSPPLPITEMVSNSHDIPSITNWLMRTIHSITAIHGRKIHVGLAIVVDFSWALIQACLQAWNIISLAEYIKRCYAVVQFKSTASVIRQLTTLHICAAHMMKTVRDTMSEGVKDKKLLQFFMFTFARLQNAATMKQAEELYKTMCVVYTSKYVTKNVKDNIIKLRNVVEKVADAKEMLPDKDAVSDENVVLFGNTLRKESPFTKIFDACMPTNEPDGKQKNYPLNTYYLENIFLTFHKRYMHLFPLFSGIMLQPERYGSDMTLQPIEATVTRLSNSLVEGWFRIVKQDTLQKKKFLPVGQFVRLLNKILTGRIRRYAIDAKPNDAGKKIIELSEESWSPRKCNLPGRAKVAKYYSVPKSAPVPKEREMQKEKAKHATASKPKHRRTQKGIANVENTCWLGSGLHTLTEILQGHGTFNFFK